MPCSKFHDTYMRCVDESQEAKLKAKAIYKDAPIGGSDGEANEKYITVSQFNKLMKMYPQPNLGQHPYRLMKRLPTQSYSDDLFNRKKVFHKPS